MKIVYMRILNKIDITVLLLIGICIFSLVSLLFVIGRDGFTASEGETLYWSMLRWKAALYETSISFHPPSYYLVFGLWVKIVGNDEFLLRLPGAILFVSTIPAVYAIARLVATPWVALLSAFLVAFSPFSLQYVNEIRVYPTFLFVCTYALLCLIIILQNPNRIHYVWWICLGFLMLCASLLHFAGMLIPILFFIILVVAVVFFCEDKKNLILKIVYTYSLVFAFWLVMPVGAYAYYLVPERLDLEFSLPLVFNSIIALYGQEYAPPLFVVLCFVLTIGIFYWLKIRQWRWLVCILTISVLPIIIGIASDFVGGSVFRHRIFIYSTIPFFILCSVGIFYLYYKSKYIGISIMLLLICFSLYGYTVKYSTPNYAFKDTSNVISTTYQSSDAIILCAKFFMFGLSAYDIHQLDIPLLIVNNKTLKLRQKNKFDDTVGEYDIINSSHLINDAQLQQYNRIYFIYSKYHCSDKKLNNIEKLLIPRNKVDEYKWYYDSKIAIYLKEVLSYDQKKSISNKTIELSVWE